MSDDGIHGLTLIAFVGSVFSPYYAWARRRGATDPSNYCALNVALYGGGANRWAMTERGSQSVRRDATSLSIGNSAMRWHGDALEIHIDEIGSPLPRRLRGTVRLFPGALGSQTFALDAHARHHWTPLAPCARVEVSMSQPELKWSGMGYLDSNDGTEPLEAAFSRWTWSRASGRDSSVILYDVEGRDAALPSLALRCARDGSIEHIDAPPKLALRPTRWRISRETRADVGTPGKVLATLEDAPFYSRSLLETTVCGVRGTAMHESLDMDRFDSRWVQCLLPFRMPRNTFF